MSSAFLEAKGVTKIYRVPDPARRFGTTQLAAVDGASLHISGGETVGIVGESGSGKSTLARLLMLLERPDKGEIWFEGKSATKLGGTEKKRFRRNVQIVFQDPLASLNPRQKVKDILSEPFEIHADLMPKHLDKEIGELLERVGLKPQMKDRRPRELSGGERQRVSIARAIALKPRLVICDEAVSSLDVLVQAQILNLLLRLQKELGIAYFFISHDLRIVRHMSDRVAVMQNGRIVEEGPAERIYQAPAHPYTQSLLAAAL